MAASADPGSPGCFLFPSARVGGACGRVQDCGAGASAEPAASQGFGLRGSWDAVGSPWVAAIWRLSRPGSSRPCWTSCRSCARVTEAGADSASLQLGLLAGSMSESAAARRVGGTHFREVRVQPPSEGPQAIPSRHGKGGSTGNHDRLCAETLGTRVHNPPRSLKGEGFRGHWKACTELNVHADTLVQAQRPTFARVPPFLHTYRSAHVQGGTHARGSSRSWAPRHRTESSSGAITRGLGRTGNK